MTYEDSICHCKSKGRNIRLKPFDRDERTRFVDNALSLLIESRFGPGCVYEPIGMTFFDLPPCEVNFDLMPARFGWFFDGVTKASPSRPTVCDAACRIANHFEHPYSPTTLARGSPSGRRTHIVP